MLVRGAADLTKRLDGGDSPGRGLGAKRWGARVGAESGRGFCVKFAHRAFSRTLDSNACLVTSCDILVSAVYFSCDFLRDRNQRSPAPALAKTALST